MYKVSSNIIISWKCINYLFSVTKQCLAPTKFSDGSLSYGSNAALNLDCVIGGVKYGNETARIGLCSLDDQGYCTEGWKISSK